MYSCLLNKLNETRNAKNIYFNTITLQCLIFAYCSFRHKPRLLGIGALSLTVGSVIMVLPHILVGEYELGTQKMYPFCTGINKEKHVLQS